MCYNKRKFTKIVYKNSLVECVFTVENLSDCITSLEAIYILISLFEWTRLIGLELTRFYPFHLSSLNPLIYLNDSD